MNIAIDGPSGAGKGEMAKGIAKALGLAYLDTGLLYRAVAWELVQQQKDVYDISSAQEAALNIEQYNLNIPELRRDDVAQAASKISAFPEVREALKNYQRHFVHHPPKDSQGVVLDGRDIGTNIMPDADVKLFVTAREDIRARRRHKELQIRGIKSIYTAVLQEMRERDARDKQRTINPLKPSADAVIIDTSDMTIEEMVRNAVGIIRREFSRAGRFTDGKNVIC